MPLIGAWRSIGATCKGYNSSEVTIAIQPDRRTINSSSATSHQ
ncbi:hypothetical protein OOK60_09110 [Trichothermofontia sichuanensis B231]|nr:hypothetical protein [Trichothermofontia sichuanensis]UZQ56417.1 hypothetical protein OOK60_09110 [Trichothermofontia sichuanensis B231]